MVVTISAKGRTHRVRVATLVASQVSADDVFIEGTDHAGAIVLAIHCAPDEARALCRTVGTALRTAPR